MNRKQKGFTLTELVVAIFVLLIIGVVIGLIVAGVHFIAKFW